MKVHLFASENHYVQAYLKFLEKNFDISSSIFVFRSCKRLNFEYSDTIKERIIIAKSNLEFLRKVIPLIRRSEKFYFHQLPYGPSLILWNLFSGLLSKSTWIIWGGDVYIHTQGRETIKKAFYEILRKRMIRRIPIVASFIPGDFEIVRTIYNSKARYLQSAYPIPVDFMKIDPGENPHDDFKGTTILIGNSGNEVNNHLEILDILRFLKDSDVRIICPLSYGGNKEYVKSVVAEGKMIFGDKFKPLMSFLGTDDYIMLLSGTDIAVMNHERQQGLGNTLPLLYFGKKVYLRKEATTYLFLKELGCAIFDIESLKFSNETFLGINREELMKNREIITNLLSEERYISLWKLILA